MLVLDDPPTDRDAKPSTELEWTQTPQQVHRLTSRLSKHALGRKLRTPLIFAVRGVLSVVGIVSLFMADDPSVGTYLLVLLILATLWLRPSAEIWLLPLILRMTGDWNRPQSCRLDWDERGFQFANLTTPHSVSHVPWSELATLYVTPEGYAAESSRLERGFMVPRFAFETSVAAEQFEAFLIDHAIDHAPQIQVERLH